MKGLKPSILIFIAILPFGYISAPLIQLLRGMSWQAAVSVLQNQELLGALGTSLWSASLTTILAILFGLPCAFLLSLRDFPLKSVIVGLLLVPLILPPIVGGIAELNLYGPETLTGSWFTQHGIHLTDSLIGVILAQSFITSPFLILSAKAGFEEVPKELKETARLFGGGLWELFWHVCVPLSKQAILTGAALTFARAIGEFGATMMMAYHPYTVPIDLWVQFMSGGLPQILPISAILVALALLAGVVAGAASRRKAST